jgi:hypothetical protein
LYNNLQSNLLTHVNLVFQLQRSITPNGTTIGLTFLIIYGYHEKERKKGREGGREGGRKEDSGKVDSAIIYNL